IGDARACRQVVETGPANRADHVDDDLSSRRGFRSGDGSGRHGCRVRIAQQTVPERESECERDRAQQERAPRELDVGHVEILPRRALRVCHDSVKVAAYVSAVALLVGSLHGTVMRGPTMPACKIGTPCTAPATHITLFFTRNGLTRSTMTD